MPDVLRASIPYTGGTVEGRGVAPPGKIRARKETKMKGKLILGCGLVVVAVVVGLLVAGIGPAEATEQVTPDEVVTGFYEWYLGYIGEGERTQNPLADRAYRSSEFLSDGFVAEVDALLDSFEGGGYDPFLQAQDVPTSIEVGGAIVSGATAAVPVETSFEGHRLLVTLELVDGEWKIDGVGLAPEMVVRDFYRWYVGAFERDGEMRNPLAEGAYQERAELSAGFKAEIEETLASFDKVGYDPILLAQDVPVEIRVGETQIGGDEAQVVVELFWGGNPTPSERMVTLQVIDGAWKIADVEME